MHIILIKTLELKLHSHIIIKVPYFQFYFNYFAICISYNTNFEVLLTSVRMKRKKLFEPLKFMNGLINLVKVSSCWF